MTPVIPDMVMAFKSIGAWLKAQPTVQKDLLALWVVHLFELKNPKKIIHIMHTYKKKFMTAHASVP